MPKSRKVQISLDAIPYYCCISRYFMYTFLCGEDSFTGEALTSNGWIRNKLFEAEQYVDIDFAGHVVMYNHLYAILFIVQKLAEKLPPLQIVEHWYRLSSGTN